MDGEKQDGKGGAFLDTSSGDKMLSRVTLKIATECGTFQRGTVQAGVPGKSFQFRWIH